MGAQLHGCLGVLGGLRQPSPVVATVANDLIKDARRTATASCPHIDGLKSNKPSQRTKKQLGEGDGVLVLVLAQGVWP